MNIRALSVAAFAFLALGPLDVAAQTPPEFERFSLQVAAGPLLKSGGHTVSAGVGFSPISRLDLIVNLERDHLPFQRDTVSDTFSITRGGELTAVIGELRASLFHTHRASPYAFAGFGRGTSRPTVNEMFPAAVENDVRMVYLGGGLRVPISSELSVFGDARVTLALEGNDGILGLWPVRAGLAWRF